MSRLIDADELISRMKLFCYKDCNECGYSTFLSNDEHCGLIDEQPTIEPVKGKWIWLKYDSNPFIGNWHCSSCNKISELKYNYCPNCGADMRED